MTKTISGDSAALAGAAGPSKESPGKPEQGSSRRIDPRLAEALRISYAASADEPDWEGVATLAFATEPGASLLADAEVGRAIIERAEDGEHGVNIRRVDTYEDGRPRWRFTAFAPLREEPRIGFGPTLLDAIAAALGDER